MINYENTQDTVLALQAMFPFVKRKFIREVMRMEKHTTEASIVTFLTNFMNGTAS